MGLATAATSTATTTTDVFNDDINDVENQINNELQLNLDYRLQRNRKDMDVIEVHKRKQANQLDQMLVLHTTKLWGWQDDLLNSRIRIKIACAMCCQIAYNHNYGTAFSAARLSAWDSIL